MVKIISQTVDTLKLHFYIKKSICEKTFQSYIDLVSSLSKLKDEARNIKSMNQDERYVKHYFGDNYFQIMATSIAGFSVVIKSRDVSIAFRKPKNTLSHTPIIKVEFRAEFLARMGYIACIKHVENLLKEYILNDYKIKVSEIHLATDIQGHEFSFLDFYRMKTRARSSEHFEDVTDVSQGSVYGQSRVFSGFWFGGGDYRFRLYNKTIEINKNKNKAFAKSMLWDKNPQFDVNKTVWRMEIQIRRAKLKTLINSDKRQLDGFEVVLNAIPDLWTKAMQNYQILDIDRYKVLDILSGYRVLKDGSKKILTKEAIKHFFRKSEPLSFWNELTVWNTHESNEIQTYKHLPTGSLEYVANSIKSVLSTMGKHYGRIDETTLVRAFRDCNRLNLDNKGVGIVEDSMLKQFDYFERVDYFVDNGVCDVPSTKHLQDSIISSVAKHSPHLFTGAFTKNLSERIEKYSFNRSWVNERFEEKPLIMERVLSAQVADYLF
ncbi:MAG: hypothetical protein PHX13_12270 [Thiovulaceae bacterium]|nr:hypothetical protein [Sulfurimonadaceae bacterium]